MGNCREEYCLTQIYAVMKNLFFCLIGTVLFALVTCSCEKADPEFYLEQSAFEVEGDGGNITVIAKHNVDYVVKVDADWITHMGTKGLSSGEEEFAISENPDNDPREGSITFVSEEAAKTVVVTVKQLGLNAIIYTSLDNKVVALKELESNGVFIVSNTYFNGRGVIKYSGEVTEIEDEYFMNKESITHVDLPSTVKKIGKKAFYGCVGLTEMTIPASVTAIGESAFMTCTKLEKINLPQGLISLGANAFSLCIELKEVTLPESITKIEKGTFETCSSLSRIGIPQGVTTIGESAFASCFSLKFISLPASVSTIGKLAFSMMPIIKLDIPEGVKILEHNTFYGCTNLEELNLPSTLTEFRDELALCRALTRIRILASEPPLMAPGAPGFVSVLWFGLDYTKLKFYVPSASVEKYKNAASWQKYVELISAIE